MDNKDLIEDDDDDDDRDDTNNRQYMREYGFYDPLMAGSIDGTDEKPHDHGIIRAFNSNYKPNLNVKGDSERMLFIGRLNYKTNEEKLKKIFSKYGTIKSIRLVRDIITGYSKGYAFIEFKHRSDAKLAYESSFKLSVDDRELIVEYEHERRLPGWIPRRLGGGLGGYKESGQLRFGGRYKPFSKIFKTSRYSHKHSSNYNRSDQDRDSQSSKKSSHSFSKYQNRTINSDKYSDSEKRSTNKKKL